MPVFRPKGLVHPSVARPPPEPTMTPIQVGKNDEDITLIQTMHGLTTRVRA
jgi:hypothetical protein